MPRQRRVVIPGIAHHVTQRGNNRRNVFFTDEDRKLYLSLLKEYTAQYGVGVIGYCLMTNHVHLIVMPGCATALAKALGRTHSDYARWLPIRRAVSRDIYGRIGFFRVRWSPCISGQRWHMWNEMQCAPDWYRSARLGPGAVRCRI